MRQDLPRPVCTSSRIDRYAFPALSAIFLLAIFLRLLFVYQLKPTPLFFGLATDTHFYNTFGRQLARGNFFYKNLIYFNALYPYFVSLNYLISGNSKFFTLVVQCVIDSINCVLVYLIARRIFNPVKGLVAALLYSVYGLAIFYCGLLLEPIVAIFLLLLFFLVLTAAVHQNGKISLLVLAGFLLGGLILVRSNIIIILGVLPFWFYYSLRPTLGSKKTMLAFGTFLVGLIVALAPIAFRNYLINHEFNPLSIQGGINFYIGNNPKATGYFMSPFNVVNSPKKQVDSSIVVAEKQVGRSLSPSEASRYWLRKGLLFILKNPTKAFALYLKKLALFASGSEPALNINIKSAQSLVSIFKLPFVTFGFLFPLSIVGIYLLRSWNKDSVLLILLAGTYAISVIIFFVADRYRMPIIPLLSIFAAYGICRLFELFKEKKLILAGRAVLGLIVICILVNFIFPRLHHTSKAMFYNNLGSTYLSMGMPKKALLEVEKSIRINPGNSNAYQTLGNTYSHLGDFNLARQNYQKALKINPFDSGALANLGLVLLKQRKYSAALVKLNRAEHIDPNSFLINLNFANALRDVGRYEAAKRFYRKALEIDPNDAGAHVDLGLYYKSRGNLPEAIDQFRQAIRIDPDLGQAYIILGNALQIKGNVSEAIACYRKAITLMPGLPEAHYYLGLALFAAGRKSEASSEFRSAINNRPDYAQAHYMLGLVQEDAHRLQAAVKSFRTAVRIVPNWDKPRMELAKVYWMMNKTDQAGKALDVLKRLNPEAGTDLEVWFRKTPPGSSTGSIGSPQGY